MRARGAVVIAALLLITGGASAQDSRVGEARKQYDEGTRLYDLGRFDEAIAKYEEAYRLHDDPAILYNIAQAHRLAGHNERAIFFYRSYLRRTPEAPNRDEVLGRIEQLQKQPVTTAPSPQPSTAPQPTTTPQSETAPPAVREPEPTAAPTPAPSSAPVGIDRDRGRGLRIAGLALVGAGALIVVGGVVGSVIAKQDSDAIDSDWRNGLRYDASKASQGQLADKLGIALDCIGGAIVVTGAVVAVLGYRARPRLVAASDVH